MKFADHVFFLAVDGETTSLKGMVIFTSTISVEVQEEFLDIFGTFSTWTVPGRKAPEDDFPFFEGKTKLVV